jgi:hypothetical protein
MKVKTILILTEIFPMVFRNMIFKNIVLLKYLSSMSINDIIHLFSRNGFQTPVHHIRRQIMSNATGADICLYDILIILTLHCQTFTLNATVVVLIYSALRNKAIIRPIPKTKQEKI